MFSSGDSYRYVCVFNELAKVIHVLSLHLTCLQIHLVEYDEELNITRKNVYNHPAGEVWHVSSSSSDPLLFSTSYNRISKLKEKINSLSDRRVIITRVLLSPYVAEITSLPIPALMLSSLI